MAARFGVRQRCSGVRYLARGGVLERRRWRGLSDGGASKRRARSGRTCEARSLVDDDRLRSMLGMHMQGIKGLNEVTNLIYGIKGK